jgi:hypothetical protein
MANFPRYLFLSSLILRIRPFSPSTLPLPSFPFSTSKFFYGSLPFCDTSRHCIASPSLTIYVADRLRPFAIEKKAAALLGIIDGAFSTRMLYGTSRKIPLLSSADAVLKSFQSA